MFPVEKVTVIFSNIEVIYDFATKLLAELQAAVNKEQPHLTEFGQCFLNKVSRSEGVGGGVRVLSLIHI